MKIRKRMVYIHKADAMIAGIGYVYVPVFIFVLTWVKIYLAILACICITTVVGLFIRQLRIERKKNPDEVVEIHFFILVFAILFLLWIGWISGWSGYGHQTEDWPKHNAILHDLSEKDWPVIYENGADVSMLTYYIGQYMVPSFLGKVFAISFRQVLCINWLWSSVGLVLIWLLFVHAVCADSWRKQVFVLMMLVFCGGMMTVQEEIGHIVYPDDILAAADGWRDYFLCYGRYMLQYRTNFISLRWAYGQTLAIWLIAVVFYLRRKEVKYYAAIFLPALFFGSFSFVSLVILAFAAYIEYLFEVRDLRRILRSTLSIQNCLMFGSLGTILLLYYIGFVRQKKPGGIGLERVSYIGRDWGIYLIFIFGSFLAYALCVFKENRKNSLFLASVGIMCVLPFLKFGVANDLLMGGCIAASFILYLVLTEFVFQMDSGTGYGKRKTVLLVLLWIGSIKPVMEVYQCLKAYDYSVYAPFEWATLEEFANRERTDISIDQQYNYYTYDAYDSPFMKYLGKVR